MSEPLLHYELVRPAGEMPERCLLNVHGAFGTGRNWHGVARGLVDRRGGWGAALVDLPGHGGSAEADWSGTLAEAAEALGQVAGRIGAAPALLGHSLGGKVALQRAAGAPDGLRQVWVVDSTPAPLTPGGPGWNMLGVLRRMPSEFVSRQDAVDALEREAIGRAAAQWMATNLVRGEDRMLRWRIDLDVIERLLRDFYAADLWPVIESPPEGVELHVVKGTDSPMLDEAACRRIERAGEETGRVHLHRVKGRHWLNADNPERLVELLNEHLPA